MKQNNLAIEEFRLSLISTKEDGNNGVFMIPFEGRSMKVVASDGMGWDHVSVSLPNRCPNWREMCFIKEMFFDDEEMAIQFHPKKSEYVNNHPHCLHLWRHHESEPARPPTMMVGIKSLGVLA